MARIHVIRSRIIGDISNYTKYQKLLPQREANPYIDAFWKWFPEAVTHMHTFRITGGEPLTEQAYIIEVMDYLLQNPQPNLELCN